MTIDFSSKAPTELVIAPAASASAQKIHASSDSFWGEDGFGIGDVIDAINPLQHIPIVSAFYRELTGDTIANGPKLIGGGVIGGVVGFFASAADAVIEQVTGHNTSEHVMALFESTTDDQPSPHVLAQANQHTQSGDEPAARQAPLELIDLEKIQELPPLDFSQMQGIVSAQAHKAYHGQQRHHDSGWSARRIDA